MGWIFLWGWAYKSGLPCSGRFFPDALSGLAKCVVPLKSDCHDVAPHLAIAIAL